MLGCQEKIAVEEPNELISEGKETPLIEKDLIQEEVKIIAYGPEGFSIEDATLSKGEILTFVNENSKEKDISITLQKKGSQKFINTEIIKLGEKHSLNIEEPGIYEFWTLGFSNKGKLVVE